MPYDISAESPVQWLRLGESSGTTAQDTTANNNDGTYAGAGVTYSQTGLVNDADTCVALSGGNNVNIDAGKPVASNAAFSVECWFTLDDATNRSIVTKGNQSLGAESNREFDIYVNVAGDLRLILSNGTTYLLPGATSLSTGQTLTTGVLYHVVVTWDGTTNANGVKVYLNGVLVAQSQVSGSPSNTFNWFVGGVGTSFCLDGQVDEFALYSDVLTLTEVEDHYAQGVGGGDSITIASPADTTFYGIDLDGTFDIPIAGNYVGTPTAIEASFNGGAFATIDAAPSGGAFSGTLSNQAAGQGTLTVRWTNDTGISDAVTISLGFVVLAAGQSNASGRGTNNQSYTHASLTAYMDQQDGTFAELADPIDSDAEGAGSPWPLLATLIMAEPDIPLLVIHHADGSTGLVQDNDWDKDGTGGVGNGATYAACVAHVANSGINRVHAILWYQGESDANQGVSRAAYNAGLDQLIADFRSEGGALASAVLISAQIAEYATNEAGVDAIRLAQSDAWDDNALIYAGPVLYDVDLSDAGGDGVHFKTDAELTTQAQRWWAAWSAAMDTVFSADLFAGGGRGPKFVSAVEHVDRDQITVTFDQPLRTGTTLGPGAWAVDDDGTPVAVTGAAVSGSTVVLSLASALTGSATTVSLGTGNSAAGLVVPEGAAIALPTTGTINLPAEPFIDEPVSAAPQPSAGLGTFAPAFAG